MPRKKKVTNNENLSKEKPEVQEALLKDLANEDSINKISEEVEKPIEGAETKRKKAAEEIKIKEAPKKDELKVGDKVKIKSNVETDTLGRRIHNGIRNYTYRVLAVRPDGFISIECLTYAFLVRKDQVNKI